MELRVELAGSVREHEYAKDKLSEGSGRWDACISVGGVKTRPQNAANDRSGEHNNQ